jgi:transcriptional regulator with XRE-family HTH domain
MALTLKALRINAGLDQRTVAKELGVTPETIGNWENSKTFPNVPQITQLEKLYGVSYADINFYPKSSV